MTFTTMLITNVGLATALLIGLAFVMSRAAKLTPHRPGVTGNSWRARRPLHRPAPRDGRAERSSLKQLDPVAERL